MPILMTASVPHQAEPCSAPGTEGTESLVGGAARLRPGQAWPIDTGSEPAGLLYRYGNAAGYEPLQWRRVICWVPADTPLMSWS